MKPRWTAALAAILLPLAMNAAQPEPREPNYEEASVGNFALPDPLLFENGKPVKNARDWKKRRAELLRLFETHVYGRSPGKPDALVFEKRSDDPGALGGNATRREVSIYLKKDKSGPRLDLLAYIPNGATRPSPAFLGLNFEGNHTVSTDPGIAVSTNWMRNGKKPERGSQASRWQAEKVIDAGYALVTMYYGDIDPDFDDGFQNGVHPLFYKDGQSKPAPDAWGSIATWAWGLSRVVDYLERDKSIDEDKIALMGHSRLGKAALWAGAVDDRFAIVISNNSGCGGAALSRRNYGETVARINKSFPHWFCDNFVQYGNNEGALPVDQHQLIALVAPRPVYVASAVEDRWADPHGEFLAAKGADPVYKLLGKDGLPAAEMPALDQPVMGAIGYHIRSGKHDVTEFDWDQYIKFADKHFNASK
jgi:hypothetical protein